MCSSCPSVWPACQPRAICWVPCWTCACPAHREPFCPRWGAWYGSGWMEARPGSGALGERGLLQDVAVCSSGEEGGSEGSWGRRWLSTGLWPALSRGAQVHGRGGALSLTGLELRVVMRRVSWNCAPRSRGALVWRLAGGRVGRVAGASVRGVGHSGEGGEGWGVRGTHRRAGSLPGTWSSLGS